MKRPIFSRTKDRHANVEVHKTVNRIGSNINAGAANFEIGEFTTVILDKEEFQMARRELQIGTNPVSEPSLGDYPEGGFLGRDQATTFYEAKSSPGFDSGPAFWNMPALDVNLSFGLRLEKNTSYIFVCPPMAMERADEMPSRMFDHPGEGIFEAYLRVSFLHELGHHFLYAFLPAEERLKIRTMFEDRNLSEGMANWFAYNLAGELERHVLAESSVDRSIAYRSYHEIRFMNPIEVLTNLRQKKSYLDALVSFSKMIGGRVTGGFNLDCGGDIIAKGTVFMDDSKTMDLMWNIICKGRITHLGPLWGNVVTPSVDVLVGRFPRMTLIVTSRVGSHPDYSKLPANVVLMSATEIQEAIEKCPLRTGQSPQQRMVALLAQLKIEDKWIRSLLTFERQVSAKAK